MISKVKLYTRKNSDGYVSHSIIIYYSKKGIKFRYSTGVTVVKETDFDPKNKQVIKGDNIKGKNLKISLAHQKIEQAITTLISQNGGEPPQVEELKEFLLNNDSENPKCNVLSSLDDYIEEFYKYKKANSSVGTGRTYRVVTTNFKKFNKEKGYKSISNIGYAYIESFETWLIKKEFCDATVHKRVRQLRTFARWLIDVRNIEVDQKIFKYSTKSKNKNSETNVYLTTEELKALINIKKSTAFEKKVIDMMTFLCMTGLYISDLPNIFKGLIKDGRLEINREKNGEQCLIPLNSTALDLLEKYNYKLKLMAEQVFNRSIKDILEKNKICNYQIDDEYWKEGKKRFRTVLKYNMVTARVGRNTFITRLIDAGVSLADIRSAVGHKHINMVEHYMSKRRTVNNGFTDLIDI